MGDPTRSKAAWALCPGNAFVSRTDTLSWVPAAGDTLLALPTRSRKGSPRVDRTWQLEGSSPPRVQALHRLPCHSPTRPAFHRRSHQAAPRTLHPEAHTCFAQPPPPPRPCLPRQELEV